MGLVYVHCEGGGPNSFERDMRLAHWIKERGLPVRQIYTEQVQSNVKVFGVDRWNAPSLRALAQKLGFKVY